MRELHALVIDYMAFRVARGFQPNRKLARMLDQFVDSLPAERADGLLFSQSDALAWANAPVGASAVWLSDRMSMVRGFAAYVAGSGLPVGVPGLRLTPGGSRRATPYLYSAQEVRALMSASDHLFGPCQRSCNSPGLMGFRSRNSPGRRSRNSPPG